MGASAGEAVESFGEQAAGESTVLVFVEDAHRFELADAGEGVVPEQRLAVLKALAEFEGLTLGQLLEKIVLHSFEPVPISSELPLPEPVADLVLASSIRQVGVGEFGSRGLLIDIAHLTEKALADEVAERRVIGSFGWATSIAVGGDELPDAGEAV